MIHTIKNANMIDFNKDGPNYTIDKETGLILHKGDYYFPVNQLSRRRSTITGSPKLTYERYRAFIKNGKISHKPMINILHTPKDCSIYHIINYPFTKWGSPQISFIGQYGYGKSRIMDWIIANWLARNHRIFQFDDAEFEAQALAFHGYFTKDGLFHPFQIILWIPKGYTFDTSAWNHNPLDHRQNVEVREFSNALEIVDNLKPHKLNVIYREAFDSASALRLFLVIVQEIKKRTKRGYSYIFSRHEFGDLFPESAAGETYTLVREIALEEIRKFRKRHIGIITSFHASYDVAYTISQKFGFIGQVRPIRHKSMSILEQEAISYKRGDVAIGNGGFFRKHHINEFPVPDEEYNYQPNNQNWNYPQLVPNDIVETKESRQDRRDKALKNLINDLYYSQGWTQKQISNVTGYTAQYIGQLLVKQNKE